MTAEGVVIGIGVMWIGIVAGLIVHTIYKYSDSDRSDWEEDRWL